jgi:hypothetical protein
MAQKPDFRDPATAARTKKKNVQQTRAVYGQFMDAMTQAPGKWLNVMPSSEMTSWRSQKRRSDLLSKMLVVIS